MEDIVTEPSSSTWPRDLPVLRALAEHFDRNPDRVVYNTINVPGVTREDAALAIRALDGRYLRVKIDRNMAGRAVTVHVLGITEDARRVVGLWPSSESVDGLVEVLQTAADHANDQENKSKLRKAAEYVAGAPRDVMVDVLGAYLAKSTFGG